MVIKVFADGADIAQMQEAARNPKVRGFTTNPSLCRKAGVTNYRAFAQRAVAAFPDQPLSFEVFADDLETMELQARTISSWGDNVYVKIPITNTLGDLATRLITKLAGDGIKVNVTAILCYSQVDAVLDALDETPAIVSIFAGRIADTGRNPAGIISHAVKHKRLTVHEILWASPRQVFDAYIAEGLGCDIITMSPDLIKKLELEGRNLAEYSKETVRQFYDDAKAAGYSI
jgi:transaldolase